MTTPTALKRPLYTISEICSPNGLLPISKSTWWEGVRTGRYPQPVKLGPRITVWRAEDIERLINEGAGGAQ